MKLGVDELESPPATPKASIIRGHSVVLTDRERTRDDVVGLVTDALSRIGWKDLDRHHMKVIDVSGLGGSQTYRVTGHDSNKLDVAVHLRSKAHATDKTSEGRMEAAANHFARHGIAGKRLAQGSDWFVEGWEGKVVGTFDKLKTPAWWRRACQCSSMMKHEAASLVEMGNLLAQIHATPTQWFDDWRGRLEKRHPVLRKAPRGSHMWYFGFQQNCFDDLREDSIQKWIDEGRFFKPLSQSAARVVTCHGDFHPANVVRAGGGLRVIDFETACVACAVQDLAWSFKLFLSETEDKRVFTEAYLLASGQPAAPEDVEALMFDAECYSMFLYLGPLWRDTRVLIKDPEYDLHTFRSYAFLALQAHESPELRSQIVEYGLTACLVERESRSP